MQVNERLATWLRRLRPVKTWHQFLLAILPFTVIPLVVLGIILVHTSQNAVRSSVLRDHRELALRAAGEVGAFVHKPQELLLTVASIVGVEHADRWHQETAIVELALRYPMFRYIVSIDENGTEIASSRLGDGLRDRHNDQAFRRAMAGDSYFSSVRVLDADTPVATIAVPVMRWGKPGGVLLAEIDLRGMWNIVDSIRIGTTGYACILDRSGALISHPDKKMVLGRRELPIDQVVAKVLSGGEGSREAEDEHAQSWLVSYAPVEPLGWGLVIFQSTTEAYASSRIMRAQARGVIAFGVIAAFLISWMLARSLSRPLHLLLEGTRRTSNRDLEQELPVDRLDEIGQILASFNKMTKSLREARQSEKLSIVGKAATAIVHEMRNSLTLVESYMQILQENAEDRRFLDEFVRVVPQELNAWKGMLNNMVEYARPPQFAVTQLDLNALVRDMVALGKARVAQRGLGLKIDVMERPAIVLGNADKLRQVFLNLLSNAMDSSPAQGDVLVSTELTGRKNVPHVLVRVRDKGGPIPAERLEKIFEPFFTTKDGGLGLGLSICREIVEHHGGMIEVSSQAGHGTSFLVILPLIGGREDVF